MTLAIETRNLTLKFGHFVAVDNVSLQIAAGSRHAIIGPNGAGKTSLVHALTGAIAASSGSVHINGLDLTRASQAQRVRQGLARTFQINQLFNGLTVLENVLLALQEHHGTSGIFWRPVMSQKQISTQASELLGLLQLEKYVDITVSLLPYGVRRLTEIAIALATHPRVLILDEPAAGVPSAQSELIFQRLSALPGDVTLIFIEHDMNLVFRFAQRISVMMNGRLLTEGSPEAISTDTQVREAYLGQAPKQRTLHAVA